MASPSPTPSPPNSSSPSSPPPSQPPPSSSDHHPNNLQLAFPISQQPLPPSQPPPPPNPRRLPPPCWSHEETAALIDAYRDKWYSLRRGNLKAPHWQEVADSVYRRCPAASPPKTAVQCRHKMEKLRKRYRTELQRARSIPVARFISSWVHFQRMEAMEKGPQMATAVASPLTSPAPPSAQVRVRPHYSDDSNEDDDDDGGNYVGRGGDDDDADGFGGDREYFESRVRGNNGIGVGLNSRSVSGLYQNGIGNDSGSAGRSGGGFRIKIPTGVPVAQPGGNSGYRKTNKQFLASSSGSGFGSGNGNNKGSGNYGSGFSVGNQAPRESRDLGLDMGRGGFGVKREREREKQRLRDPVEEMVGAIKVLGDGFVKMEQMKMEMAREIEASRMEMELKRTEMILDSQQRMVEAFAKAVWEKRKKAKRMPSPGV